jgi:hypothetical protein
VAQSFQESERAQADKPAKTASADQYIRFSSRRGTYNTITFSSVEIVPSILNGAGAEEPPVGPQVRIVTAVIILATLSFFSCKFPVWSTLLMVWCCSLMANVSHSLLREGVLHHGAAGEVP